MVVCFLTKPKIISKLQIFLKKKNLQIVASHLFAFPCLIFYLVVNFFLLLGFSFFKGYEVLTVFHFYFIVNL